MWRWLVLVVGCNSTAPPAIDPVALDACVTLLSCRGDDIGLCIDQAMPILTQPGYFANSLTNGTTPYFSPRVYRCIAAARNNCDAAEACFGPPGSCAANMASRCEGTLAISCGLRSTMAYLDCAANGRCLGAYLQFCTRGETVATDCRVHGFDKCVVWANGVAVCQ